MGAAAACLVWHARGGGAGRGVPARAGEIKEAEQQLYQRTARLGADLPTRADEKGREGRERGGGAGDHWKRRPWQGQCRGEGELQVVVREQVVDS